MNQLERFYDAFRHCIKPGCDCGGSLYGRHLTPCTVSRIYRDDVHKILMEAEELRFVSGDFDGCKHDLQVLMRKPFVKEEGWKLLAQW